MSASSLLAIRLRAGLTQMQMAKRMGFTRRGYQGLEDQRSSFAPRHLALLERISVKLAIDRGDPSLALPGIFLESLRLAKLAGERDGRLSGEAAEPV